jgi:sugar phosphate isomerase/epimerase
MRYGAMNFPVKPILNIIKRFSHRIGHVHISDNLGKRDDHLPIGEGNINFMEIIRALKHTGYNDTVTLEVFTENRRKIISSREKFESMLKD